MRTVLLLLFLTTACCSAGAMDFSSYSTAGQTKAQGVDISIDYPAAWTPRSNPRPGVVQEFRDPATDGHDALVLVVIPTPKKATAEEFRKAFELPEAQERIMPGARHRKKEFFEDLDFPCVVLDYDLEIPQLAPAVAQVRNYIVLVDGKMVQLQFYGVAQPSEDIRVARKEMMEHVLRSIKKGGSAEK
jgi:hypothetical protein